MGRNITRSLIRNDKGAIAPIYALAAVGLIAAGGIAFDAGRMMAMDTELQNAADQAALAAATQLDRQSGAIANAIGAARGGLVTNFTLFANDGGARNVDVPAANIFFYATKANAEADTSRIDPAATNADAQAAFVRVVVATRTARMALTPIVSAFSPSMNAAALAGMGSALCRTPPVMICNPAEADATSDPDFNANNYVGFGLKATGGGGSSWAPGNYGYLQTGTTNGAPGVRQALGWITPPGNCISQNGVDTVDTEPGNMTSVTQALNTRFDIYDNQGCETGGLCPASINSRKDLVRPNNASGNNACKTHNNGWQEVPSAQRYLPPSNAALPPATTPTSMGFPRDICHAVASGGCTGAAFGDGTWDRDAYFRSHYLRPASNTRWTASDWQANTGLGANPTRYQVYKWEIDHRNQDIDGVRILAQNPFTATGNTLVNHGQPVCSQAQSPSYGTGTIPDTSTGTADRRRMSVAVVNCRKNDVRGNSTGVPVKRWIDVFLVQPSANRDRTSADEIYVEIIGETDAGSDGELAGAVIRRDVPYLIR